MNQDSIQTCSIVSEEPVLNSATALIPTSDKAAAGLGSDITILPGPSTPLVV